MRDVCAVFCCSGRKEGRKDQQPFMFQANPVLQQKLHDTFEHTAFMQGFQPFFILDTGKGRSEEGVRHFESWYAARIAARYTDERAGVGFDIPDLQD